MPASDVDCNLNFRPDACDIADGSSTDVNGNGVPDECEGMDACPADVNDDGVVDVEDLVAVIVGWGPCAGVPRTLGTPRPGRRPALGPG